MTEYRVFYEQGNGYHCGCCRQTQIIAKAFDNLQDAEVFIERLEKLKSGKIKSKWENDDDVEFLELIECKTIRGHNYLD